jgi:Icc-related predicted phosphoesterase
VAIFNKLIRKEEYPKLIFLEHESANIEGLNIFGSPFSPRFGDWAYMYKRNIGKEVWSSIPDNTQILITHSPPKSILDLTDDMETGNLVQMGCKSLYNRVLELGIDYHIYGHCHSNSKLMFNNNGIYKSEKFKTTFINAACLDHSGQFYQGHLIEI